jgi:hypothetical protein
MASESMEVIFAIAKDVIEDGRVAIIQKSETMYALKIADFIPDDEKEKP